jgi:hypothetical protein
MYLPATARSKVDRTSNSLDQVNPDKPGGPRKDDFSGKYEGVAKSDQLGDIPLTVEIKNDNGKLSGKIDTPQGPAAITSGSYADGKITMKFDAGGNEGTVTATMAGDKVTGKWELGGQGGPLELKKVVMASAAVPSAAPAAAPRQATSCPVSGTGRLTPKAPPYRSPSSSSLKATR